ncbi:MAG: ABC transporter permease [Planctomycetota bacterium]|jgi:putative ABC transport system permease protein
MKHILYLAWKYLRFNRGKTLVLVGSISLILFLPAGLHVLVEQGSETLTARAQATPLLLGPMGSAADIMLSSLYFKEPTLAPLRFAQVGRINETGLARGIPLHMRYTVEEQRIVGTTLDYFDFRELILAQGRKMSLLGECVLGAEAARALNVSVGEAVISTPAGAFDVAGTFPLKMPVVGILKPTGNADDLAVFVDLKTSWVISGLAHGHMDVTQPNMETGVLKREEGNVVANASVLSYTEITPDNLDSFHFHGDPDQFPVDAVIVVPQDRKAGILLRGRYQKEDSVQMLVPLTVIQDLLDTVFVVRDYVVLAGVGVAGAAFMIMALVFALSIRLRKREIETIRKIGGARQRLRAILCTEIVIVVGAGIGLAALLTSIVSRCGNLLLHIVEM